MIKYLKTLLLATLLVGSLGFAYSGTASAAFDIVPNQQCKDAEKAGGEIPTACIDDTPKENPIYGPDGIITKVANIIAMIVGVAAVIVIIIAGIQYMVSTGDPTKTNNAKRALIYAIVGLAVVVIARAVVLFVIERL